MDIIILRIASTPALSSINKFQIRACVHHAYLLFGVRAIGAETRNIVLHLEYFKYFDSKICIFCFYILRIISNTFSPFTQTTNALLKFVSYGPWSFFDKLAYTNMCEYDVETTLKRRCIYNVRSATLFQRWNNVRRRRKFSSTLIQRCFNVECLLGWPPSQCDPAFCLVCPPC